jgi:photosystem II stability/assembly factor-like uncharacterized protein
MHPEVLLSNRGLIFGSGGANASDWALMCNEAMGVTTSDTPDLAVFPDGRMMTNTTNGLLMTSDNGCSWPGVEPFSKVSTPGMAQHPTEPNRVYISTYGPGAGGVSTSPDAGKTWQQLLMVDDNDYLRFVRISPSDPKRIYVRSLRFGMDGNFVYGLLRTDNAGQTWARNEVSVMPNETDFILLGVSPENPDLLVGMGETVDPASMPERLVVSHDGGKTFSNAMTATVITAISWSDDGKTLYVASDEGLFRSSDEAKTFNRVGVAEYLSCATVRDGALLVCGYYKSIAAGNPGIGISMDGGETFTHYMNLNEVAKPLECAAQSATGTACSLPWTDWERELLIDGGVPLGGAGAAAATAGTISSPFAGAAPTGPSGGPSAGAPAMIDAGSPPGAGTAALDAAVAAPAAPSGDSSGCSFQRRNRPASLPQPAAVALGLGVLAFAIRRRRQ